MAGLEDKILSRSGEELLLEQTIDRFTVALPLSCLNQFEIHLSQTLDAEVLRSLPILLPDLTLVELRVLPERLQNTMQMARELQPVQFVNPVYWMQCSPGTPVYLTHQITVQFMESTDAETMRTIANSVGLRVVKLVPGIAKAFVFELMQRATANPLKLVQQLMRHPQVLMAEPNVAVPIQHYCQPLTVRTVKEDDSFQLEQAEQLHQAQSYVETARSLTQGDRSIAIAVTERAIDWQPLDLRGFGKIVAPLKLPKIQQPEDQQVEDRQSETSQQGEAQGEILRSKLQMLSEFAPDCALMPIEIGDWLDDQLIEQICEWASEQGAAVLVCAWGAGATYFPLSLRQRAALSRLAIHGRGGKGCITIFANQEVCVGGEEMQAAPDFGNSQDDNSQNITPSNPAAWLNGFAVHPDVITVASDRFYQAILHNRNMELAVCATSESEPGDASAIVAGVAALMLSVNSNLTARVVKQILQDTADRIVGSEFPAKAENSTYDACGYSRWFGYGKVNALKAVEAARQRISPIEIPDRWIKRHNATALEIPDGDRNGACSAIDINDRGAIKQVEISLEIAHSFMGDLEIYLISPQDKPILLQNRTLGRITLLRKTYNFETAPLLKTLLHQPVTGRWQIKVVDWVVLNTGQLQQWQLKFGVGSDK